MLNYARKKTDPKEHAPGPKKGFFSRLIRKSPRTLENKIYEDEHRLPIDLAADKGSGDYQTARYQEIDSYPVNEPYASVRILHDNLENSFIYYVVEPELTKKEKEALDQIKTILQTSIDIPISQLDIEPEKFLRKAAEKVIRTYKMPVEKTAKGKIMYYLIRDTLGYGVIDVMMKDPQLEDISFDGLNIPIYLYHRGFENIRSNLVWRNELESNSYVTRLAQRCKKHISVAEPIVDATLPDGSRAIFKLGQEVNYNGSTFTIRKFRETPLTPVDLIDFKTLSAYMAASMWWLIEHGASMLFCGGTASGKTTTLNALSMFIPQNSKIVSIEETYELNLPGHEHWVRGRTREGIGGESAAPGAKRAGEVDMYDLLRASLRERPEYILVGEIRGKEASTLFQAMATGHTAYSTVHAENIDDLIHRLENKPIEIPRVMITSIDLAWFQLQTRIGEQKVRRGHRVVEITGLSGEGEVRNNLLFDWIPATDTFESNLASSKTLDKLMKKTGQTKQEVLSEIARREQVLQYMVDHEVREPAHVASIIHEYSITPEKVIEDIQTAMDQMAQQPASTWTAPVSDILSPGTPEPQTGLFQGAQLALPEQSAIGPRRIACSICKFEFDSGADGCPSCGNPDL